MQRIGSRAQVMHGNAKMTGGGLKKKDLKYNKQGKIVSKKMSTRAKKEKRLQKAGYITKKGQFGAVRIMSGGHTIDEMKNFLNSRSSIIHGDDQLTLTGLNNLSTFNQILYEQEVRRLFDIYKDRGQRRL